ncbi:lytic transglycosylase domain-containing protein [Cohnella rhizosphaerae]|uniref:Lytic transglycosylase domain-containing protein n=1 Tax=Cohnella rhizosphaerae TaxID=1457232 RepID=A0A9X4QV36_9BACL|nr:lytic transglycosylase domain-containing protein [Cohnella rhizosphaerae]MDG0812174.1 lytic transglycosylase domain-containing protein [Cohnella rhizosphaerae]
MTYMNGITGSVDPRMLKQLLLAQLTSGIDPFAGSADAVTSGAGDDNLFTQLLSQYMGGTGVFGSANSDPLTGTSGNESDYASLGLLSLNARSDGAGLGLSSLNSRSFGTSLLSGVGSGELAADGSASTSAYDGLIQAAAARYGIDPALIKGVIQIESSFNPTAGSSAGAKGLMQLMDSTAAGLGVADSFDPAQNIDGGSRYLSYLLRKYDGSEMTALAAYNAGPGRVDRIGLRTDEDVAARLSELPAETQAYIGKVLSARSGWTLP